MFQAFDRKVQSDIRKYPEYPVADGGYGSLIIIWYCEEHGMKKYMKFTMYEKENKDKNIEMIRTEWQ